MLYSLTVGIVFKFKMTTMSKVLRRSSSPSHNYAAPVQSTGTILAAEKLKLFKIIL